MAYGYLRSVAKKIKHCLVLQISVFSLLQYVDFCPQLLNHPCHMNVVYLIVHFLLQVIAAGREKLASIPTGGVAAAGAGGGAASGGGEEAKVEEKKEEKKEESEESDDDMGFGLFD